MVFTTILLISASATIPSCNASQRPHTRSAQSTFNRYEYASLHMGSRCSIVVYAPTERSAADAVRDAFAMIHQVELALSDYNPESESMCATSQPHGQWVPASPVFLDVMMLCQQFYELSDGAFDPTIGVYTHLWRQAKQIGSIPTQDELAIAKSSFGFSHVRLDTENQRIRFDRPDMIIDFGAIGKGYAADRALQVLKEHGLDIALVDLGGDLALGNAPPDSFDGWSVSVQTGLGLDWETSMHSSGLATSGDLERFYQHQGIRYSHIIDPRTGLGLTQASAVTVHAADATTADALASIVSIVGDEFVDRFEKEFPGTRFWVVSSPIDGLENSRSAD